MEFKFDNFNQGATNSTAQLEDLEEKCRNFRWNAAMAYHKAAPALSRIMMLKFMKSVNVATTLKEGVQRGICKFCGSIFVPGNHTIRIAPKSKLPKDIKKLKRMQSESSWKLKGLHKKYIQSIHTRASIMIYRCLLCKKCTKLPLKNAPIKNSSIQKSFQYPAPHTENKANNEKKTPSLAPKLAEPVLLSNKQILLDSTKKTNKKKKSKQQKKKGNFCQLKQLLKSHNSENTMKSRLESFLSSI